MTRTNTDSPSEGTPCRVRVGPWRFHSLGWREVTLRLSRLSLRLLSAADALWGEDGDRRDGRGWARWRGKGKCFIFKTYFFQNREKSV